MRSETDEPRHEEVASAFEPHAADVEVVLRGEVAILNGVVEDAAERQRIVEAISSLESISEVEDYLRPPAA